MLMIKLTRLAWILSFAALWMLDCSNQTSSEKPELNTLTPEERASGWILLFDGRTLEGWEDPAKEDPPGNAWFVEHGCIKTRPHPRLREDLFTTRSFGDFELVFDWRISALGNSGVKYLVQDRAVLVEGKTDPDAERFEDTVDFELTNHTADRRKLGPDDRIEEYVIAFEFQIIDNEGHPDAAEDPDRQSGSIYGLLAPVEQTALPVGQFNQSRIVLQGTQVEHWLNGRKVVDVDLTSEKIRNGLEKRWTIDSPVYELLTEMPDKKSPIVLQHHNDEVWFRNIKIRPLD
jgi:hypothetical protein